MFLDQPNSVSILGREWISSFSLFAVQNESVKVVKSFLRASSSLTSTQTSTHRFDTKAEGNRSIQQYHAVPHSTTGTTPSDLLFDRTIRKCLHLIRPELQCQVHIQTSDKLTSTEMFNQQPRRSTQCSEHQLTSTIVPQQKYQRGSTSTSTKEPVVPPPSRNLNARHTLKQHRSSPTSSAESDQERTSDLPHTSFTHSSNN